MSVCQFFSKKLEYLNDKTKSNKDKGDKTKNRSSKTKKLAEDSFDDIINDSKELFYEDNSDGSQGNLNDSFETIDNYLTEKAFHNDLESSLSITERSGKFILLIYVELLRIIKPIEKETDM